MACPSTLVYGVLGVSRNEAEENMTIHQVEAQVLNSIITASYEG